MQRPSALAIAAGLMLALGAGAAEAAGGERPNVLLIVAEDLSPRLGAYGDAVAHTPHLDQLAREGVRYTRAFTTAGVCAPSRAAILMGVHQDSWGAGHMRAAAGGYVAVPPPEWKGFPELLRRAGYYAVNNGKTDYQMSTTFGGAWGGPFSIWDEESGEDWRGRAEGKPFFAYLTLENTHESRVWPTWSLGSWIEWLLLPMRLRDHWQWEQRTDPAEVVVPPYYPDTPTVRADLARHYDNIAAMDARVGAILAKLEADGLAEDTVVLFSTDHGDGLPRAKRWPYDSGIRVPLIVRWPGALEPGSTNEELVSGVDLAPTLLALAGLPKPAHMQGRVLLGPRAEPEPAYVYAARDRIDDHPDTVRAVRDRRFAYVRHLRPDQPYVLPVAFRNVMPMMQEMLALHEAGELDAQAALWFRPQRDAEELFDTDADPHQLHNLAADPAARETLQRMRAELDRWLEASGDLGLLPEAELAERFWPGGEQPVTATPEIEPHSTGRFAVRCATAGASIAYAVDEGPWQLYAAPFTPPADMRVLRAKAVRYGWAESEEAALRLD